MNVTEAGSGSGPASGLLAAEVLADRELADETSVWLVRHGETEWSRSGQHTGTTDLPLTELGERQACAVGDMLGDLRPALVLSSPLKRALRTAELAGLRVDDTVDDLVEWNYGDYEGRTSSEIRETHPGWTIWEDGAAGGETPAQVGERADRVLARIAGRLDDGPIVLVGHGHFSRALGARWLGLPVAAGGNLLLGTAAPCVLGAQYGVPAIVRWNLPNPAA